MDVRQAEQSIIMIIIIQLPKAEMRHEKHSSKPIEKQLKQTINSYSPMTNELKPKSGLHIPRFNQYNHSANETFKKQSSQMSLKYTELSRAVKWHQQKFMEASNAMEKAMKNFYSDLKEVISRNEKQACDLISKQRSEVWHRLQTQSHLLSTKAQQARTLKKVTEQNRVELHQLSTVDIPYYKVEANPFKEFEKIAEEFKTVFVYAKANKNHQNAELLRASYKNYQCEWKQNICSVEANKGKENTHQSPGKTRHDHQNTIKKQTMPLSVSAALQPKNDIQICEFTCDEELDWNPRRSKQVKRDRHEIVSEIILEEPSSCEDSLMLNDNEAP